MNLHTLKLIAISLCFSASSKAEDITIYNWINYLSQDVIDDFTQATGHSVNYITYDDEDIRDTVITSERGRSLDLVVLDSISLQIIAEQGLFRKIPAHLQSDNYDKRWLEACGEYGIPYSWGTTGILYRSSLTKAPPQSWAELFEPAPEFQGKTVMYLDLHDAIGSALLAAKKYPFSEQIDDLKAAFALMQQQQPHLLASEYGLAYAERHGTNSQMGLSFGYSGDLFSLKEVTQQQDWKYTVPKEGSLLWGECLAAPSSHEISTATIAFIEYLNQPEVAAKNAQDIWFATPNLEAVKLSDEEYQQDEELFPNQQILNKSHPYIRLSAEALHLRVRMLNTFKR